MLKYLSSSHIPPSTYRTQTEHFVEPLTASARHRFLKVPWFLTLQSNIRVFSFILRHLYWQYFLVYEKTAQLTQIAADYLSMYTITVYIWGTFLSNLRGQNPHLLCDCTFNDQRWKIFSEKSFPATAKTFLKDQIFHPVGSCNPFLSISGSFSCPFLRSPLMIHAPHRPLGLSPQHQQRPR